MGLVTDDLTAQMPVKEELDRAVPPHELLDVSASKAKAELATRGGLAGRQLPTSKKGSGGLSSSSSVSLLIFLLLSQKCPY
jgi:neurabin